MQFLIAVFALLLAVCGAAPQELVSRGATLVSPNQEGNQNVTYNIVDLTWVLEAEPHIPKHLFTGTVNQVVHHVKTNYPAYPWPRVNGVSSRLGNATTTTTTNGTSVEDLSHPNAGGNVQCWRFDLCTISAAWEGINYLLQVPGQPKEGPGPGSCGRVSCADDAGIWWCNDNADYSLILGGFNWIADYALAIEEQCEYMGGSDTMTRGQNFHPNQGWNVILGGARC